MQRTYPILITTTMKSVKEQFGQPHSVALALNTVVYECQTEEQADEAIRNIRESFKNCEISQSATRLYQVS